ncbi:MAG TPA: RNA polymerase sigma factor [Lacunisphaera sp.]|jgi:RNA polymerase sigma-70 factor (ECF subfamily)
MPESAPPPPGFASFYRATLTPLRRYLARMLRNRDDAKDVAHDAYCRIFQVMDREPVERPQGLLFTTARRMALNQIKRREIAPVQGTDHQLIEMSPAPAPGVEHLVMARQEWAATQEAISRLPPGCRAVLLLCRVQGCTHREAATRLGLSPKTVEKQHARALRLLRASLQKDNEMPDELDAARDAAGR